MRDFLARLDLGRREPPWFGQVSLWILLGLAFYLGWRVTERNLYYGVRVGTVTVLGWLPEPWRSDPRLFPVLWMTFTVCAALWAYNWLLPFSSWGATLAFTLYVSAYLENLPQWDHKFHLTNLVLFVYCAWYHFDWREIHAAARTKRFWSTPLYPRWVYLASVYCIACHYFLAGLSKLINGSGLRWADGLTLQLWILARGDATTALGAFIVAHRAAAMLGQAASLLLELSLPLALFSRSYRWAAALALAGFHLLNMFIFPDVVFLADLGVVATFFLLGK